MTTFAIAALITAVLSPLRPSAVAQSRTLDANSATFEVASIKANKSSTGLRGISFLPGRLRVTDLTVREIVAFAYDVPNPLRYTRIPVGAKWFDSDRFDIVAKAEGTTNLRQSRFE